MHAKQLDELATGVLYNSEYHCCHPLPLSSSIS